MRILHTSDWHVGKRLGQHDLDKEQQDFFSHLFRVVDESSIDAVLVSGDIYDRATPSLEAVDLLNHVLVELSNKTKVIITSGNHDGAIRLGFAGQLLEKANVFFRTSIQDMTRPIVLENDKQKLLVYGIPYLDPFLSSSKLFQEPEEIAKAKRSHDLVLGRALAKIREHKQNIKHDFSVVMSHAWFTGADPEGSEIDITVGGIGYASTEHLKGFDYAALGHIHRPKIIEEHIRYSGSALPYSFGEEKSPKRTTIVDFSGKEPKYEEIINENSPRLHELSASLDELMESPQYKEYEDCYLKINLSDKPEPNGAGKTLRQRFPKLVDLKTFVAEGVAADWHRVDELNELDLCCEFIEKTRQVGVDDWEKQQIQIAIELVRNGNVKIGELELEDEE